MQWYVGRDLIGKLTNRFRLILEKIDDGMLLSNTVQPVTSVDSFPELKAIFKAQNVGATGDYVLGIVPPSKRWKLICIRCELTSGTFTMNLIKLRTSVVTGSQAAYLKSATAGASMNFFPNDGFPIIDQGWSIEVTVNGYTGAGAISSTIIAEESDA